MYATTRHDLASTHANKNEVNVQVPTDSTQVEANNQENEHEEPIVGRKRKKTSINVKKTFKKAIRSGYTFKKEVYLRKQLAVINDTGNVGSSRTVADFGGSRGETGGAVTVGKIVPELKHRIDRICSNG
ncbi:hypothetical protein GmHk_11G033050 [Glycine max]|nr:hypothetical protein GmHk_11G033050 [Glycine max]